MIRFAAAYFDGKSADRRDVEVTIDGSGLLSVEAADLRLQYPLAEVRIAPRIGNTPRSIYLPDGGKFETRDNDALDRAAARHKVGAGYRLLHALESRLGLVALVLLLTVAVGWGTVEYGVPALARQVAYAVPRDVDLRLGGDALAVLDELVFEPSQIDPSVQSRVRQRLAGLVEAMPPDVPVRLEFRAAPTIGPNAFALPSGIVVVTDALVKLAEHDDELVAVLAHEIGHVHHRHALRGVLQGSITVVLIAVTTGDLTSLTALSGTLPALLLQMKYSRAFELEADDYARAALTRMGIAPTRFTAILERMSGSATEDAPDYLSTHPATAERVRRFLDPEG